MRDEFAVHLLNDAGKTKASPRDLALVRTKLQEACFFAKRSMAVLKENQESAK